MPTDKIQTDENLNTANLRMLFTPVRKQIKESRILDNELTALLEEVREEAYQEKQSKIKS